MYLKIYTTIIILVYYNHKKNIHTIKVQIPTHPCKHTHVNLT